MQVFHAYVTESLRKSPENGWSVNLQAPGADLPVSQASFNVVLFQQYRRRHPSPQGVWSHGPQIFDNLSNFPQPRAPEVSLPWLSPPRPLLGSRAPATAKQAVALVARRPPPSATESRGPRKLRFLRMSPVNGKSADRSHTRDKSRPKSCWTTHQPPSGFLRRLTVMSRPSSPFRAACYPEKSSPPMKSSASAGPKFQQLVEIMARLRGPDGCPWDREQTFDTIKPYTLEETYEVLDAIDRRDWPDLPKNWATLCCRPFSTRRWPPKKICSTSTTRSMPSTRSWCAAIRMSSASNPPKPRATCCASGTKSKPPKRRPRAEPKTACWRAFRARCRRWWRRSRSLRARPASVSIGRIPSR